MKIETERLILRKPRKSDWKDVVDIFNNKEIVRYLSYYSYPFNKKDAEKFILNKIKQSKDDYYFFIELKNEKKVIGAIHLHVFLDQNKGLTAYWVNRNYWNEGYLTEAKINILNFAFNKLRLRKMSNYVFSENKSSNKLQEKFGYKLEGILRKDIKSKYTGKIHDQYVYGLFKEEWKKNLPKLRKHLKSKIKKLENKK